MSEYVECRDYFKLHKQYVRVRDFHFAQSFMRALPIWRSRIPVESYESGSLTVCIIGLFVPIPAIISTLETDTRVLKTKRDESQWNIGLHFHQSLHSWEGIAAERPLSRAGIDLLKISAGKSLNAVVSNLGQKFVDSSL